nr:uncharacterized protein LOC116428941 [Nomia melanderi]
MCSNESPPPAKEPLVGLGSPMGFLPGLEHYRLQLYHYAMAERLRLAQQLHPQHPGVGPPAAGGPAAHLGMGPGFPAPLPLYPAAGYPSRLALSMALLHPHHQRVPEEPKPQHSYIGLIVSSVWTHQQPFQSVRQATFQPRKRQFDVASLLAPDDQLEPDLRPPKSRRFSCSEDELHDQEHEQDEEDVDVDVVAETLPSPGTPSSPDAKVMGHWNQSIPSPQVPGIHLNHLQARSYYVPATSGSANGV